MASRCGAIGAATKTRRQWMKRRSKESNGSTSFCLKRMCCNWIVTGAGVAHDDASSVFEIVALRKPAENVRILII